MYRKNSKVNERNILSAGWTPDVTKPVAAQTLLQPHHQSLPGTQPRRISDSILRLGEPYLPLFLSWSLASALFSDVNAGAAVSQGIRTLKPACLQHVSNPREISHRRPLVARCLPLHLFRKRRFFSQPYLFVQKCSSTTEIHFRQRNNQSFRLEGLIYDL